jgi:hypothetical protein
MIYINELLEDIYKEDYIARQPTIKVKLPHMIIHKKKLILKEDYDHRHLNRDENKSAIPQQSAEPSRDENIQSKPIGYPALPTKSEF